MATDALSPSVRWCTDDRPHAAHSRTNVWRAQGECSGMTAATVARFEARGRRAPSPQALACSVDVLAHRVAQRRAAGGRCAQSDFPGLSLRAWQDATARAAALVVNPDDAMVADAVAALVTAAL